MSFLASWRTALRVARREARRARGRSTLVVAMIALPVLALTFAAVSYDMMELTGAEKADRTMGSADARIQWPTHRPAMQMPDPADGAYSGDNSPGAYVGTPDRDPAEADPRDLPGTGAELVEALPGSTVLPLRRGTVAVTTPNGLAQPDAVMVDATSPLTKGYVELLNGRAPAAADEVALTEQAMAWLEAGIGGTVRVRDGDVERPYTVVGQVEFPSLLDRVLLFAYSADDASIGPWFSLRENSWLVDTPEPITWDRVLDLNQQGMFVASRAVLLDPPPDEAVPLMQQWGDSRYVNPEGLAVSVLVAGLALLEVVLLAGPAFAVSARRRQRQLALVAANGGTPAHVRRIVLADGVVLGLLGAAAGIAIGIVGAFVARPWVEELLTHERGGAYRIYPEALAAITGLAVLTGLAAALVPAFVTARQSVVAALAGRRGVTRSRKRWIVVGIVMAGAGVAVTVAGTTGYNASIMLTGLVLAELGLVLCTPALVGLIARIGRLLPLTPRIAVRDAARNRAAAAPAISAVMAAVAGSVLLGTILDSDREHGRQTWVQEQPTGMVSVYIGALSTAHGVSPAVVESTIRSILPIGGDVHDVGAAACPDGADEDKYCSLRVVANDLCPQIVSWQTRELTDAERREAAENPYCDVRDASVGYGLVVDDGSALSTLTGTSGDDLRRARETLAAGGVVVTSPLYITDGTVTLASAVPDPDAPPGTDRGSGTRLGPGGLVVPPGYEAVTTTVPGYLLATDIRTVIASPAAVERAGLSTADVRIVASTTRPPTDAEMERFYAAMDAINTVGSVERGFQDKIRPEMLILIGAAALIMIGAAAVGTGLAAADGRGDLSTLAAVGASPRLRRGLSVSQCWVIAGLGSVLGSLAGFGAAVAIIEGRNQAPWVKVWPSTPTDPVLPWLTLGVVLVAVPLIAILGAGLLTRSRLPIERRL